MQKNERLLAIGITLAGLVGLIFGWRLFWFLCDDAFISFRYVSNSVQGLGYVWNAAPFQPVEGYSNFLWVVLLDLVWRLFGADPTKSANLISLGFSALTLITVAQIIWAINWRSELKKYRVIILAVTLLGILSNRTFLAWTSSGLETACYNFLIISWIRIALFSSRENLRWGYLLFLNASLLALTRPDGPLFCAASGVMWLMLNRHYSLKQLVKRAQQLSPLLLVLGHLLWRRLFYGAWLPNTYFAKHVEMWPESGIRYVLSFVLEYAIWFWVGLIVVYLVRNHRQLRSRFSLQAQTKNKYDSLWLLAGVSGALAVHWIYYTFIVGGDHFEYRIYSHLIPLFFLSGWYLLDRSRIRVRTAITTMVLFTALALPVQWTHWSKSHNLESRQQTLKMTIPIAPHWPTGTRWYAGMFDEQQSWLINHYVCMRHQEHKIALQTWLNGSLPSRSTGQQLSADNLPVMVAWGGIGGLGWVLPGINIIDKYGLNDRVVARAPWQAQGERRMAHDRQPPPGYIMAFRPNVQLVGPGRATVSKRAEPLTADEIIAIEKSWWLKVSN